MRGNHRMMRMKGWLVATVTFAVFLPGALPAQTNDEDLWDYTIPEGTEFKLQLHTTVHTKKSKEGDRVIATLVDPVVVEDADVLPRGLRIDGHVGEVLPARRKGKGGWLTIIFDTVELPGGEKISILGSLTEVFATEGKDFPDVGLEGEIKGGGAPVWKRISIFGLATAGGIYAGTATGIVGGIAGLITAIVLPKGKNVSLSAGSVVGMRLDRDITISLALPPDYE